MVESIAGVEPRHRLSTLRYSLIVQGIGLPVAFACPGYVILANYLSIAPKGMVEPLLLVPFLLLAGLMTVPAAILMSLLMMNDRCRRVAANMLILCVVLFSSMWFAIRIGGDIRRGAFLGLAHRSKPLVQAINDYQADHGSPPSQLTDLVPRYLSSIPGTGMGAYPEYHYEVHTASATHWTHLTHEPWVLWLHTPRGILDFDMFIYLPSRNYATWAVQYGSDNWAEPIGDWAYIHE